MAAGDSSGGTIADRRERESKREKERGLKITSCATISLLGVGEMFVVGLLNSEIWELSSAECVDRLSSSHSVVIVSLKPIPLLAINEPRRSKRS